MPTAVITGASAGLGRATAHALGRLGWSLIVDGRRDGALAAAASGLPGVDRAGRRCDGPGAPGPAGRGRRPGRAGSTCW